jgi:hypothetical protein
MSIDLVAVTGLAESALEIANSDHARAPFILKPLAEAALKLTEELADYQLAERQLIEERDKLREALPGFYEDGDITMNKAACDWVDTLQQESKRMRAALEEVIAFVNEDLSSHDNRWVSRRCADALDLPLAPVGLPVSIARIDVGERYCSTCRHLADSKDRSADFDCNSPNHCDQTNSGWEPRQVEDSGDSANCKTCARFYSEACGCCANFRLWEPRAGEGH